MSSVWYDTVSIHTARWLTCADKKILAECQEKLFDHAALDINGGLTYLAPSRVHLNLTIERWPEVAFHAIREH